MGRDVKQKNREQMPQVAEWVDFTRKHFGEPVAIEAEENGKRIEWRKNNAANPR